MTYDRFSEPRADVRKDALISPCGLYRYWLSREWDPGAEKLAFIMLNPSTADAEVDDPTIRRCMAFARRDGFGGIVVANLFAFRATDPAALKTAADPVGPDNDIGLRLNLLTSPIRAADLVVAAWGANCRIRGERDKAVRRMAADGGVTLHHLGLTKDGHPKHPLYIKGDQPLERWS
jgi:hypothetical protein